ncbi:MAG: succinate--CoA ligase subunit beta [Anaerolineae bacterium CG2_30_64_16]|nr:MAG: succinate--CoA ligase subunit beta [Anaerolineae bacterium CG2_30_64_16]
MKLQEFQSKRIFAQYGVPIPDGDVATTPAEARVVAGRLGGTVAVKSQVLVGGRGKAGGIKLAKSPAEAEAAAGRILGMNIKGMIVKKVLVDAAADLHKELYLGMVIDRGRRRVTVMASSEGGVDIEEVAARTPEKIIQVAVDPCIGLKEYQTRDLAMGVGLPREQWAQFAAICQGLYDAFMESDATLAEINPLVVQRDGKLLAVDGKMVLDDSALYRHPDLAAMRDEDEETPEERTARLNGLSYVKLDGQIGCMVNGAGLAMATMDITKFYGGAPANFLDIGGGAKADKVAAALRIILTDPHVNAVLFNIFGGITRCDEVARGILQALGEAPTNVPMVVRLVGTNDIEGRAILKKAKMMTAETLMEAAQMAVAAAQHAA